jgi:hypothetical protein
MDQITVNDTWQVIPGWREGWRQSDPEFGQALGDHGWFPPITGPPAISVRACAHRTLSSPGGECVPSSRLTVGNEREHAAGQRVDAGFW